jgi:UPF0176 protein
MAKIILFYKYIDIENVQEIAKWQRELCTKLELKGRIVLAQEGINGTLGGNEDQIEEYIQQMNKHPLFGNIDYKESLGLETSCFAKLKIWIRNEICHLGVDTKKYTPKDGGKHLKPEDVHKLLKENPEDLIILDARNKFEADVGRFENAIVPDIRYFRQFPEYIDKNLEQFKDKKVLMYCTGGVRCERATTYLKSKKIATEIYQIEGGIHRYTEKYPDGFFRGKNYVFDDRITVKINDDILGACYICKKPNDDFTNCLNAMCNRHYTCCLECKTDYAGTCSRECQTLIKEKKVNVRPQIENVGNKTIRK